MALKKVKVKRGELPAQVKALYGEAGGRVVELVLPFVAGGRGEVAVYACEEAVWLPLNPKKLRKRLRAASRSRLGASGGRS